MTHPTSKPRFDIELIEANPISRTGSHWCVTDTQSDSRVTMCFDSDNARMVRDALNAYLGIEESSDDRVCEEADGCPTELAVLKRYWRENRPMHGVGLPVETSETHPDTIRVEWLLRYVSGAEWRRLGAVYSAGMNRTAPNDLMAPKEPTAFQDFVAGLPEEPKAPPRPQCDDCANAWPELCPRHLAAVKASGHPVMACIFRDGCRKFPACMTEDRCCGNDASIPKTR